MKRTGRKFIDIGLLSLFVILFLTFIVAVIKRASGYEIVETKIMPIPTGEEYEASYVRLNSIDKMISFCDSFYQANHSQRSYPGIVSEVLRKRFYHGYSYYSIGTNPLGVMLAPLVGNGADAIVLPDDIAKHSNAACSQQSIVGMEIFERKGYQVRKISMFDTVLNVGHFAYEVYYDNGWHFFDTNQEPDTEILRKYNRPSVAFLSKHPDIVAAAYHKQQRPDMFERLILAHTVGPVNVFPAPNAYIYQVATKFFSYFGWLFVGLLIVVRYWIRRRKGQNAFNVTSVQLAEENTSLPFVTKQKTTVRVV